MSSLCCAFKRSQDYSSSQHDSIDDDTTTASGKRNTDSPTITSSRSHSRINGTLVYENDDVDLVDSFVQRGYRTTPILYINGKRVTSENARQAKPNQTLLSFLRDIMHLTGSKLGCGEGGCGACTVMISRYDRDMDKILHYSVNACLMPVLAADCCHITTVEGLGTASGGSGSGEKDGLHPIQRAMVNLHGSQCGFCTPGIVVAIYALFANNPTKDYIEEHLDGNLCRCTGYRPIWDAARVLCSDGKEGDDEAVGPCGTPCVQCPEQDTCTMECNSHNKKDGDDIDIQKVTASSTCCSSSDDKICEYSKHETIPSNWLDTPNSMFPDELKKTFEKSLIVVDKTYHEAGTWFKATSLKELLYLLKTFNGECKIVVGNTEVGIEIKFKHSVYPRLISPSMAISSLYTFDVGEEELSIGSCVPLSTIQHECSKIAASQSIINNYGRFAKPISDMLRWFASTQIRNVACLGGNLVTASPISDMNPMLACLNAKLIVSSCTDADCGGGWKDSSIERREVLVSEFFVGYRKVDLKPFELIESINILKPRPVFEYVFPFKQARRREDDISIVTSGMRIVVEPRKESFLITDATIAFGGMAPRTVIAFETIKFIVGKTFCRDTFISAQAILLREMNLPDDVPGGQPHFRKALACSFLYKLYLMTSKAIKEDLLLIDKDPTLFTHTSPMPPVPKIDEVELSASESFIAQKKPSTKGTQTYPKPKVADGLESKDNFQIKQDAEKVDLNKKDVVGKAATHSSAALHCSGEAYYTDDMHVPPNTLHATLILSKTCNVDFLSIDTILALKTPGVVAIYTHEDVMKIGGDNTLGFAPIGHDEYVFLPNGKKIEFVGQVLGICVADTLGASEVGARSVQIQYGEFTTQPIVSIEDAIENKSFYDFAKHKMERSQPLDMTNVEKVVEVSGTFRCGGQEHFYLETNASLVVPSESGSNLTIYTSTQAVNKTQMYCAAATNTPASKVVVSMKRMGGGFGGKETRSVPITCAAAIAAKIINMPVKLTLSRDVDMTITGGRHAFLAKYNASAVVNNDKTVQLCSLDVQLFNNGGSAADLSGPVMDRALFHLDNCYYWPSFSAVGTPCKTSQAPHTAFRGFGGPQGLATCEHIIDHLALECNISSDEIRRNNFYKEDDSTPFGMVFNELKTGKWNVPNMYEKLYKEADVVSRREEIKLFNSRNKFVKRGMALTPTKFGIAFTAKFMNQGGALVHLYTDGTVLVSHGGTEMGQGLHTKVCQIAAQAFAISLSDVYINDTSSDKVANSIPSAASMSTDMYGMATLDACRQILRRIEPIRQKCSPNATLRDVASKAFYERVDLSAHGFYTVDDERCGYEWEKEKPDDFPVGMPDNSWKGNPFNYFTQGVACSEVEIDILTGNYRAIRADIFVDVGCSINPALDIGQIEGAFVQGMGWCTLEEMIYGDDHHEWVRPAGKTFTTGPGTYKIPAFNDVPENLNVTLVDNVDNPFAVHSSKAIGEPPFFLGCSVFFAIKDAIKEARRDKGATRNFELRMPATSERIRMACLDDIAIQSITTSSSAGEDTFSAAENYQPRGSH